MLAEECPGLPSMPRVACSGASRASLAVHSYKRSTKGSMQGGSVFGTFFRDFNQKGEERGRESEPVVLFFLRTQSLAQGKGLSLSQEEREAPSLGSFSRTKPCNLLLNPA